MSKPEWKEIDHPDGIQGHYMEFPIPHQKMELNTPGSGKGWATKIFINIAKGLTTKPETNYSVKGSGGNFGILYTDNRIAELLLTLYKLPDVQRTLSGVTKLTCSLLNLMGKEFWKISKRDLKILKCDLALYLKGGQRKIEAFPLEYVYRVKKFFYAKEGQF